MTVKRCMYFAMHCHNAGLVNDMRKDLEVRVSVQHALILKLGLKMCMKFGGEKATQYKK